MAVYLALTAKALKCCVLDMNHSVFQTESIPEATSSVSFVTVISPSEAAHLHSVSVIMVRRQHGHMSCLSSHSIKHALWKTWGHLLVSLMLSPSTFWDVRILYHTRAHTSTFIRIYTYRNHRDKWHTSFLAFRVLREGETRSSVPALGIPLAPHFSFSIQYLLQHGTSVWIGTTIIMTWQKTAATDGTYNLLCQIVFGPVYLFFALLWVDLSFE